MPTARPLLPSTLLLHPWRWTLWSGHKGGHEQTMQIGPTLLFEGMPKDGEPVEAKGQPDMPLFDSPGHPLSHFKTCAHGLPLWQTKGRSAI